MFIQELYQLTGHRGCSNREKAGRRKGRVTVPVGPSHKIAAHEAQGVHQIKNWQKGGNAESQCRMGLYRQACIATG